VCYGIHLPQYGRAASGDAIARAAKQAEDLGFDDIWVSDHVIFPVGQSHPSPFLYDALFSLTWGAAPTKTIGLGTSVLVAAQYHPLWLANALATIDALSEGRLTIAICVGWSEREFEALGQSFKTRGRRTDEIIDILRAAWSQDPVSYEGSFYAFKDIRVLPKPAHRIPIWIGGHGEPAFQRAAAQGDGYHAIGLTPENAAERVARIRRYKPDAASFPISLRIDGWDPQRMAASDILKERDAFEAAGIQKIVPAPLQGDAESWLRSVAMLAEILSVSPRS